jgi:hypothetical protein
MLRLVPIVLTALGIFRLGLLQDGDVEVGVFAVRICLRGITPGLEDTGRRDHRVEHKRGWQGPS